MKTVLEYVAVLGCAAFTGTMICIGLAFGRYWMSLPPEQFLAWFAINSGFIASAIPVVAGPAALGLLGSLALSRSDGNARTSWAIATVALVGVGIVTGLYHLPTNAAFVGRVIPVSDVPRTLQTWLALHALRVALGGTAAVFALRAAKGANAGSN